MVTAGSPADSDPLQHLERQPLENYPFLAVLMTVLLAAPYAKIYESDPRNWDWLFLSGILVFLVAYPLSLLLPDRVGAALRELQAQGILRPKEAIIAFEHRLKVLTNQWARVGGTALAGIIFLAWLAAFRKAPQVQPWQYTIKFTIPGILVEMALAIAVGRFIGRGLCYGTLANKLRVEGITFRPIPSHEDRMAGLSSVGSIYFAHVILIAPIIAFLSVWIVLFRFFDEYSSWRLPYVGLLVFMAALEVVTVFRPLHAFNRILLEWKQETLRDMSEREIIASEQQQRFMREQRDWIERTPTWVLSRVQRWSLTGVNILVVAPLLLAAAAGFIRV
jgi:hypothetical protein